MLKLPNGWFSDQHVRLDEIKDLFNVTKNKLYNNRRNRRWMLGKELVFLIKSLYTKENLLAHPVELFLPFTGQEFSRNNDLARAYMMRVIDAVGEDNLWTLFFFNASLLDIGASQRFRYFHFNFASTPDYTYVELIEKTGTSSNLVNVFDSNYFVRIKATTAGIAKSWNDNYDIQRDNDRQMSIETGSWGAKLPYFLLSYAYDQQVVSDGRTAYTASLMAASGFTNIAVKHNYRDGSMSLSIDMNVTRDNRAAIYNQLPYSTDVTRYIKKMKREDETDPVLYGIELELSTNYTVRQLVDAAEDPFFIIKSDSSVTGSKENMFEVVTAPISFKRFRKEFALWMANLDDDMIDTTTRTTNGMHIHVGRDHFANERHLTNFTWFFLNPSHYDFMLFFSERDSRSMDQYAKFPRLRNRNREEAYVRVVEQAMYASREDRHAALNFNKAPTIEVRIFKGIVSYTSVMKNLEFVDAIFHFTKDASLATLDLKHFFDWLDTTPRNRYLILKKFFANFDSADFVKQAKVLDIIFGQTDGNKIMQLLNATDYRLDPEQVRSLNQRYNCKLTIDKETGKLVLSDTNFGRLSKWDKELLAQQAAYFRNNNPRAAAL